MVILDPATKDVLKFVVLPLLGLCFILEGYCFYLVFKYFKPW